MDQFLSVGDEAQKAVITGTTLGLEEGSSDSSGFLGMGIVISASVVPHRRRLMTEEEGDNVQ